MRLLGLDIGKVRTGIAYVDEAIGVPTPVTTIVHQTIDELFYQLAQLCDARSIDALVVGLPLLPSGEEGEQAEFVRSAAERFTELGLPIHFVDERYTTPRPHRKTPQSGKHRANKTPKRPEDDAIAALHILNAYLKY